MIRTQPDLLSKKYFITQPNPSSPKNRSNSTGWVELGQFWRVVCTPLRRGRTGHLMWGIGFISDCNLTNKLLCITRSQESQLLGSMDHSRFCRRLGRFLTSQIFQLLCSFILFFMCPISKLNWANVCSLGLYYQLCLLIWSFPLNQCPFWLTDHISCGID